MTLTNHTTSLELSIALKKAGWPQEESLFYWSSATSKDFRLIYLTDYRSVDNPYDDHLKDLLEDGSDEVVSSPTASELMERMPPYLIHDYQAYALTIKRIEADGHCVMYEAVVADKVATYLEGIGHDEILPNALAKLALFLLKEKLWLK